MQHCSNKVLATPFAVKKQTVFEGFTREVYQSLQNWAKQHLPQANREKLNLLVLVNFMSYKALLGK